MTALEKRISIYPFGKNIEFVPAIVLFTVAKLVAGCAGGSTPEPHTNPQPSPLSITSDLIPSARVQITYAATFTATGGTAPYRWSLSGGALPAGLTLSSTGTISGTPTASGSFSFTVKVRGATTPRAQTATRFLSLSIEATYAAVLLWRASTSADVTGYNVCRSTVTGGSYTKINSSLVIGTTYYFVTTSVDTSGIESVNSNQVQAVIP